MCCLAASVARYRVASLRMSGATHFAGGAGAGGLNPIAGLGPFAVGAVKPIW